MEARMEQMERKHETRMVQMEKKQTLTDRKVAGLRKETAFEKTRTDKANSKVSGLQKKIAVE